MKIKILVFLCLILVLLILNFDNGYDFEIEIKADNFCAQDMDSIFAHEINEQVWKIAEIKDLLIISRDEKISIYCKFKAFDKLFKKQQIIEKITRQIENSKNVFLQDIQITYFDNLNYKYSSFFVVSTNKTYEILEKYSNFVSKELLNLKIAQNILILPNVELASYIYYSPVDLKKYNLDISSIENLIKENNVLDNFSYLSNQKVKISKEIETKIETIDDIKNIHFLYDEKSNPTKFSEVFEFENDILSPIEALIDFDDKKAKIFAISKKWYYPQILLDIKLNNLKNRLEKTYPNFIFLTNQNLKYKKRIDIFLNNNSSINSTIALKNELQKSLKNKNILYFIGTYSPKITKKDTLFENERYRLTLFLSYFDYFKNRKFLRQYILKPIENVKFSNFYLDDLKSEIKKYFNKNIDNNFLLLATALENRIKFEINNYFLKGYFLDKKETKSAINSYNQGQVLDYYFSSHNKIPIILKVKNPNFDIFIYSKLLKSLIPLNAFCEYKVEEKYSKIIRKNGKYFANIIKY